MCTIELRYMERERINSLEKAKALLRREVAIAMHNELRREPAFTATLEEMVDYPALVMPFPGSGQEMMEELGADGVRRAIVERMVPKIRAYYSCDNWGDALSAPIVYDEDHVIVPGDHLVAADLE